MATKCLIITLVMGLQGCLFLLEDPEPFPEENGEVSCPKDAAVADAWLFMYSNDGGLTSDSGE